MKTFLQLLGFLRPFLGGIGLSVLASTATIASSIGLLGTSAFLISSAALQPSIAALQVAIVGVRFFGISRGVFRYLERLSSHSINFKLLANMRVWFYQALEPLSPARLISYQSGDLLQRAVGDIEVLENFYVRVIAPPLAAILITLGVGLLFGSWNPSLEGVLISGLLLGGIAVPIITYHMGRNPGQTLVKVRAEMSASYVETLQGLADLLAYGQETAVRQRLGNLEQKLSAAQMRLAWAGGSGNALGQMTANLTLLMVLIIAIPLVSTGKLEGVFLAVISLVVLASFEAVSPLPQAAQMLEACLASARRLFELADLEPAVKEPPKPLPAPAAGAISLRNITFRYDESLLPVLQQVDLSLPPGRKIALVGPSGAGKSTIMALLMRFWEPNSGTIVLDENDYRLYRSEDTRRIFALVSQSTYLFTATLRQNLLLAKADADEADLVRVLDQAGLQDWFRQLPGGLDTWLGERGQQMSGGERQRLAVARMLLQDAQIVLLDEPTAHLDAITERQLIETLHAVLVNRTVLWATHNLVAMDWMDEIVVLDGGQVVEHGTHDRLLQSSGLYAHLWKIQNSELIPDL
ncbi:MAG TPA: thiol reductant ABC exporter subunit CydC [Longilinea sp.]|nr:thiol reductant ABC exporter subunit CydC [Longilinea sp.]